MDKRPDLVTVETERLRLRPYRADDHAALHRMTAQAHTFRWSHRGPMTSEESWTLLLRHIGHWACFGWGAFAVEEKSSGEVIGQAGLSSFNRDLGPRFDPWPEMTWSLDEGSQGRGYATEAARAALDWIERSRGGRRTVCLIHEGNDASFRVAERLGYRRFDALPYRGYPAVLLERG
jgi:RimJ/RimL family protein N-acetyltransferase